ncbi:MAG: YdiU family protein [Steroidobacteraceae bacterium]
MDAHRDAGSAAAPATGLRPLESFAFDARFVDALPADPRTDNAVRQVPDACYSRVAPTPVARPRLLAWSDALGDELGIARPARDADPAVQLLAGNVLFPGMQPYAARYGGHQFGNWAGQLGDGRAITLGELVTADGRRLELQLTGAGPTPYSRFADGRAVLRSSLREFLCSEAMHHLGVPTTRALSLVASGEGVVRDMFYDGRPRTEPGAIVCRIAPSFVRFGNFEIHAALGETTPLAQLCEHVIATHFPQLAGGEASTRIGDWFIDVCRRTAELLAQWMRVGFVHGVMNTDNLSILGLTIDYGPYGWMEDYEPQWTPNTTDAGGRRYCFQAQPQIGQWNLARLAGALLELVPDRAPFEQGLAEYRRCFDTAYRRHYAAKLGLPRLLGEADDALLGDMFALMETSAVDFTIFFRGLAQQPLETGPLENGDATRRLALLAKASHAQPAFDDATATRWLAWLDRYVAAVTRELPPATDAAARDAVLAARRAAMQRANPWIVPRNYLAQLAIDAAEQGDMGVLERLLAAVQEPYVERADCADFAARRPGWARERPGCSMLSCSS